MPRRTAKTVLGLGALVAVHVALSHYALYDMWTMMRATGAVNLAYGHRWYASDASVALINQIYPPLSFLVFFPLAFAHDPFQVWLAGSVLTFAYYVGPVALVLRRTCAPLLTLAVFVLASYLLRPLHYASTRIHADAPALGFATLAYLAATARTGGYTRRCLVPALLATLAVWTKQSFLPLLAVLPLWAGVTSGWRALGAQALTMLGLNAVFLVAFGLAYGFGDLAFCLFTLPLRHPLRPFGTSGAGLLLAAAAIALGMTALGVLRLLRETPLTLSALGDFARRNDWLLAVGIGFALLPPALRTLLKVGSDVNDASPFAYFLLLGWLLAWTRPEESSAALPRRLAITCALGVLAVLFALGSRVYGSVRRGPAPVEQAFAFARRNPGVAYFPEFPLATLMAEGKLHHFYYGIREYELAGFTVSQDELARFLPPHFSIACTRQAIQLPLAETEYFARFTPVAVADLPEWRCLRRPEESP